jgi:hypothetical protein
LSRIVAIPPFLKSELLEMKLGLIDEAFLISPEGAAESLGVIIEVIRHSEQNFL